MIKIITEKPTEITIDDAVYAFEHENRFLTIGYRANSDTPYFCVLKEVSRECFGFLTPVGLQLKFTYKACTLEECIAKAISGGREVIMVNKQELANIL